MNETNAERLKWIKNDHELSRLHGMAQDITRIEIDWLIEQAERAQELESQIERHKAEKYKAFKKAGGYLIALEKIAQETGTPYADIASKALGENHEQT